MKTHSITKTLLFVCFMTYSFNGTASTMYVTDEFEVTMRSGTSTSNNIIRMLKSGQTVTLIEEDLASKYSLVETEDGKTGYVLSRFLSDETSAKHQLAALQNKATAQQEKINLLNQQLSEIKKELKDEKSNSKSLKETLMDREAELARITSASENTLLIQEDNERLKAIESSLREEKLQLSDENIKLRDTTQIDWFVRGAGVCLIAFLLGIGITRIRWRKQDSWGSY